MTKRSTEELDRVALGAIPGHTTPGVWKVQEVSGIDACVMLDDRIAHLPKVLTPTDDLIRKHEWGHIRWSMSHDKRDPLDPIRLSPHAQAFRNMVEEWLVDARLFESMNVNVAPAMDSFDWSQIYDVSQMDRRQLALGAMQLMWRVDHYPLGGAGFKLDELRSALDTIGVGQPDDNDVLDRAYTNVLRALWNDANADKWALILAAHFEPPAPTTQTPPMTPQAMQQRAQKEQEASEQFYREQQMASQRDATEHERLLGAGLTRDGTLDIHNHLTLAKPGKRIKEPSAPRKFGAIPTLTERLYQDGAIFEEDDRPASSLLIDGSGSMHWTPDQLIDAIRRAPNTTVAVHDGYEYDPDRPTVGRLCVVARRGRVVESFRTCETVRGNGGTDLPALGWLARQPAPRVWISDGKAWEYDARGCGYSDPASPYSESCRRVMRRARIARVHTIDVALRYLNGAKVNLSYGLETDSYVWARRRG